MSVGVHVAVNYVYTCVFMSVYMYVMYVCENVFYVGKHGECGSPTACVLMCVYVYVCMFVNNVCGWMCGCGCVCVQARVCAHHAFALLLWG